MELERLRYSRDGRYILAQDESSISVLTREPFHQIFRFDAEKALPAEFSPDSQRIVFHTPGLHTEEWNVKDQKLVAAHEPIARKDCVQTKISPDGRTLFCFSIRQQDEDLVLDVDLLDASTGQSVLAKKGVYTLSRNNLYELLLAERYSLPVNIVPSSFSADGNIVILSDYSDKVAFDLRTREQIPLGGGLKGGINGAYAFLGNNKVFGVNTFTNHGTGVFSFPDGKQLQTISFVANALESVSSGNYVLSYDVNEYAVGLADLSAAKFILASKAPSMDVYDSVVLNENADGSVVLHKLGGDSNTDKTTTLNLSPLGPSLHGYLSTRARAAGCGILTLASGCFSPTTSTPRPSRRTTRSTSIFPRWASRSGPWSTSPLRRSPPRLSPTRWRTPCGLPRACCRSGSQRTKREPN
jgi:hypothetical protein